MLKASNCKVWEQCLSLDLFGSFGTFGRTVTRSASAVLRTRPGNHGVLCQAANVTSTYFDRGAWTRSWGSHHQDSRENVRISVHGVLKRQAHIIQCQSAREASNTHMSYGQAPFVSASRGALLKSFAVLFVFIVQMLVACLYTCT